MTYFVFKDAGYTFEYLRWCFDKFGWAEEGPAHRFENLDCARLHARECGGDVMEVLDTDAGEAWRWL